MEAIQTRIKIMTPAEKVIGYIYGIEEFRKLRPNDDKGKFEESYLNSSDASQITVNGELYHIVDVLTKFFNMTYEPDAEYGVALTPIAGQEHAYNMQVTYVVEPSKVKMI